MIKPETALEWIGQITDHILFGDRDLGSGNRERTGEEDPLRLQSPCAKGSTDDSIKVIVGDDLFVLSSDSDPFIDIPFRFSRGSRCSLRRVIPVCGAPSR